MKKLDKAFIIATLIVFAALTLIIEENFATFKCATIVSAIVSVINCVLYLIAREEIIED